MSVRQEEAEPLRLSVNLPPAVAADLDWIMRDRGLNRTEAVCRAVQRYAELARLAAGGGLYARERPDAEMERLKFL